MSNSRRLAAGLALLGACAAMGIVACESVPLTAAPGTSMTLIANPPFVIANGGVSVVTAILVEPAGTFVPDGTEVFFFTEPGPGRRLGQDGERGGPRQLRGRHPLGAGHGDRDLRGARPRRPSPAATGARPPATGSAERDDQRSAAPCRRDVLVAANPQRITSPRQSTITATVFDQFGNPVQNVPVAFSLSGSLIEETLASGGAPRFTDSNGQARDTLLTRAPAGGVQKTVEVAATTANGIDGSVTVFID